MSNSPISSITNGSLHQPAFSSANSSSANTVGPLTGRYSKPTRAPTQLSAGELTSMYARQFATTKASGSLSSIYQAAANASVPSPRQQYSHGLTVLQCARTGAPVDPHVYRDWLIFEERLKQNYRRLQKKKRSYL
ncbi:hypothetical protein FBU59_005927, partial [Linderina macrospora]